MDLSHMFNEDEVIRLKVMDILTETIDKNFGYTVDQLVEAIGCHEISVRVALREIRMSLAELKAEAVAEGKPVPLSLVGQPPSPGAAFVYFFTNNISDGQHQQLRAIRTFTSQLETQHAQALANLDSMVMGTKAQKRGQRLLAAELKGSQERIRIIMEDIEAEAVEAEQDA